VQRIQRAVGVMSDQPSLRSFGPAGKWQVTRDLKNMGRRPHSAGTDSLITVKSNAGIGTIYWRDFIGFVYDQALITR
jgi:hypothetical protein